VDRKSFIEDYELENDLPYKIAIKVTYFLFTTLTTVGFGDYAPRSQAEAVLCTIIMFVGVAVFGLIM